MSELATQTTNIPGLLEIDLVVHRDERGWFKESYQAAKLAGAGLMDFHPVQNNFSYNAEKGVTRGVHAEPWDKYISLANGSAFAAIVDLRAGSSFGQVVTFELSTAKAIFVPRGCGNSFQTLEPNVVYTYLVNEHWSTEANYKSVDLFDPELAIPWPIGKGDAIVSDKDKNLPLLRDVEPFAFDSRS